MPDYSLRSVVQYGKPYGPIRLRDTGSWQTGLYVKVDGSGTVEFASTDSKDQMLRDKYGDAIEGLSEKYKAEAIRDGIRPAFNKGIQAATGLTMK
jgi:hypothetical protein